jgi:drug/metabolite transporter (DMT)-like permease
MFGGGAVMCTLAALLGMQQGLVGALPNMATDWVVAILGLSLMISVANLALQYGASRLKANTTSLIMLCEVIFASVSSVLLGAGTISLRVALGGGLILLAALLATLSSKPSPNPSTGD